MCALSSYSLWALVIAFVNEVVGRADGKQSKDDEYWSSSSLSSSPYLQADLNIVRSKAVVVHSLMVIGVLGVFCTLYQLYSLFFTCYAYHSILEVVVGYFCGYIISTIAKHDICSDSLSVIFTSFYLKIRMFLY